MVRDFIEFDRSQWKRARLKELLDALKGKRALVVGDIGLDQYTIGNVERISPEAPVPVVAVTEQKLKLGLAANVADNVQVLGGVAKLVGVLGSDRGGDDFRALLRQEGIDDSCLVTDPSRRTILKERIVSERQQLLRVDYENLEPISDSVEKALIGQLEALIADVDTVILEDYAKGCVTRTFAAFVFEIAARAGKAVLVDPHRMTPVQYYTGATILKPNAKEAEKLSGVPIRDRESLLEAGNRLLQTTQAKHVLITRGKDGVAIFSAGQAGCNLIPTSALEVYDVSGAGDTVSSVLALALAAGAEIEEAAVLANIAAGVVVGKRGTATVTPAEIVKAMDFFLA